MSDGFGEVAAVVLEAAEPDLAEQERLADTVRTLRERAEGALTDRGVEAEIVHVGSTARGTWVSSDRDIDLFVRFPVSVPREDLERYGLEVGREVLPDPREEYAEHPYVTGTLHGFDVDIVPCYAVETASAGRSSVDRTPFHTQYLADRITEDLITDIRVFKQFLKGIGVYGSSLRVEGFSGYLTELLVLEYGDTRSVLEAASNWEPPVVLDPEDHGTRSFGDPLVVIDPTDPTRNVAAVLAPRNLARLQHHARDVLRAPRDSVFFPTTSSPITPADLREHLDRRDTTVVALVITAPDIVDDELYPQLRKSAAGIRDELDRLGFSVFRDAPFARDHAVLLFELRVPELPGVERHDGPPVAVREHAERFYDTYADAPVYGPFIEGDRYVVERDRSPTSAVTLLESEAVFDMRLGPAIRTAFRESYDVLVDDDLTGLIDEFGPDLYDYFHPRP